MRSWSLNACSPDCSLTQESKAVASSVAIIALTSVIVRILSAVPAYHLTTNYINSVSFPRSKNTDVKQLDTVVDAVSGPSQRICALHCRLSQDSSGLGEPSEVLSLTWFAKGTLAATG